MSFLLNQVFPDLHHALHVRARCQFFAVALHELSARPSGLRLRENLLMARWEPTEGRSLRWCKEALLGRPKPLTIKLGLLCGLGHLCRIKVVQA